MKIKYIPVMLALMSGAAMADTDADLKKCMDDAGSVVMAMKQCMGDAIVKLDKQMKPALAKAEKSVSPDRRASLKKSQLAWVKFNKANCEAYVDPDAGQMATLDSYSCDYEMRKNRIKELVEFAKQN